MGNKGAGQPGSPSLTRVSLCLFVGLGSEVSESELPSPKLPWNPLVAILSSDSTASFWDPFWDSMLYWFAVKELILGYQNMGIW